MAGFITNYKNYVETNKYKQSFIALKTGMDVNKVSRILNEKQPVTEIEMSDLANAIGKDISYFLMPNFQINVPNLNVAPIACYMGSASKEQEELISNLIDFAECIDAILGVKFRISEYEEQQA